MRRLLTALTLIALLAPRAGLTAEDSVSAKTYNTLTDVQEMLGEGRTQEAITDLTDLLGKVEADTIDQALTLQMLGYAEVGAERFDKAVVHLKQALATGKLPESVKYNVGYMVAQLHAAEGEFDEALDFAAEWFETLENPKPSQTMFMANIYAQLERYAEAIPYAERAVASADEPRQSWYQLITAANFELERYADAATTLERMIEIWPDEPAYWEQLASVHMLREDQRQALAALKVAWIGGRLDKESSLKSMVQLAVARGIPEQAARLLLAAFDAGALPRNEAYVKMLANAWMSAREHRQAVDAFTELAELRERGDPMLRVANLHIDQARWPEAQAALERALDMGLDEPGKAWLLLGVVLAEQDRYAEGMKALRKARTFDDTASQARRWLKYAEDMRKQYEWQQQFRG